MSEVIIIGLDIAKHVFIAHGADERGRAVFSKRISRGKLLDFFATQPCCTVALEACGESTSLGPSTHPAWHGADRLGATYKARELQSSGRSQGMSLADLRSSEV